MRSIPQHSEPEIQLNLVSIYIYISRIGAICHGVTICLLVEMLPLNSYLFPLMSPTERSKDTFAWNISHSSVNAT